MSGHMEVTADPRRRAMAFLSEFMDASDDADIEIRAAVAERGEAAIAIFINGGEPHGFTAVEARIVASVAENTMRAFPAHTRGFANLIMALRAAADKSEAQP